MRQSTWRLRARGCKSWASRRRRTAARHCPHRAMKQVSCRALPRGPQARPTMPRLRRALLRAPWAASTQGQHPALPQRPGAGLRAHRTACAQGQEQSRMGSAAPEGDSPARLGCRGRRRAQGQPHSWTGTRGVQRLRRSPASWVGWLALLRGRGMRGRQGPAPRGARARTRLRAAAGRQPLVRAWNCVGACAHCALLYLPCLPLTAHKEPREDVVGCRAAAAGMANGVCPVRMTLPRMRLCERSCKHAIEHICWPRTPCASTLYALPCGAGCVGGKNVDNAASCVMEAHN